MSLLELILRIFLFKNEKLLDYSIKLPEKTKLTPELINDIKKLDEYSRQANLISCYKIEMIDDLSILESKLNNEISPLLSKRENLWKKHKKAKTNLEKQEIEKQIANISKAIFPISEDVKTCKKILCRIEEYEKMKLHKKLIDERKDFEGKTKNKNNTRDR